MKPQTITLSILLVATIGYSGYLRLENAALRSRLLEKETLAISAVNDAEETPADAELESEVASRQAVDQPQAQPEEQRRDNSQNRRRDRATRMAAAFNDPAMRVDMIERQMDRIDQNYAGFFKSLDLDPDEMETLRTIMAERSVLGWESRMRRSSAASDEEQVEARRSLEAQRGVLDVQVAELLGKETAAKLSDYSDSLPYRREVEALASSLSFTNTPLSAEQNELLVQGLQTVSSEFEYTKDLSNMRGFDSEELSDTDVALYFEERSKRDEMVIASAAQALNEEQLTAFAVRQIADRERDQRRMEFMIQGRTENPDR